MIRLSWQVVGITALALAMGCGPSFERQTLVNVFATHHGTPDDDMFFPSLGDDAQPRVYSPEDGLSITLQDAFLSISAITLYDCDGREFEMPLYRDPSGEDLTSRDLGLLTLAGRRMPEGRYCTLAVTYGPYITPPPEEQRGTVNRSVTDHFSALEGNTVYLRGAALFDDTEDRVPFELRSSREHVVELDLQELEDSQSPLRIRGNEHFPKDLTISKTYDRFLDAADWVDFDERSIQSQLGDVLERETRVFLGQVVTPEPFR